MDRDRGDRVAAEIDFLDGRETQPDAIDVALMRAAARGCEDSDQQSAA